MCSILFGAAGIITPEKELKVSVGGGTQPLLLAKEEDVATKRSKPTEDSKFCHEQVNMIFPPLLGKPIFLCAFLFLFLFLIIAPNNCRTLNDSMLLKLYVNIAIGNIINSWYYF